MNKEKYRALLNEKISPRYVEARFPREEICNILQGEDIKKHVEGCDEIILFAATLGLQADELIRQTEAYDMAGAVILDELASIAIEEFCDSVTSKIRYSPGYGDFPLEVQQEMLKTLDAKKKIGLYANESNLLIPRKSITAVIGRRVAADNTPLRGEKEGKNEV